MAAYKLPIWSSSNSSFDRGFFLDWYYDGSIKMIPLKSYSGFKISRDGNLLKNERAKE